MRKKIDPNPQVESYVDVDGQPLDLESWIKDEVKILASEHIYRFGKKPSHETMVSWMRRLKQAYHKGIITEMRIQ